MKKAEALALVVNTAEVVLAEFNKANLPDAKRLDVLRRGIMVAGEQITGLLEKVAGGPEREDEDFEITPEMEAGVQELVAVLLKAGAWSLALLVTLPIDRAELGAFRVEAGPRH